MHSFSALSRYLKKIVFAKKGIIIIMLRPPTAVCSKAHSYMTNITLTLENHIYFQCEVNIICFHPMLN